MTIHHVRTYDNPQQWMLWFDARIPTITAGNVSPYGFFFARAVVDDFGNLVIVRKWM